MAGAAAGQVVVANNAQPDDLGRKKYYWKMHNKRMKKHDAYREMMQRKKN